MDKKTLQKKIESGDTVWGVGGVSLKPLQIEKGDFENYDWGVKSDDGYTTTNVWNPEFIFATKEEAEWVAEFGNITRTEKLELPTWEQMQENIDWGIDCANRNWYLLKSRGHSIIRIEDWNSNGIYEKPLTYENYLEACRLCKKLFLGEEL